MKSQNCFFHFVGLMVNDWDKSVLVTKVNSSYIKEQGCYGL